MTETTAKLLAKYINKYLCELKGNANVTRNGRMNMGMPVERMAHCEVIVIIV